MSNISVVINTLNEENNIGRVIGCIGWVDEIVVVDDGSTDNTLKLLDKLKVKLKKLKIFHHHSKGYVEPARNFAISKASGDWILILDADEEIPKSLSIRLQEIGSKMEQIDYVEIPRKNIIFGKWMKASMWWPDYQIRFFKRDKVVWSDQIHIPPKREGHGLRLDDDEKYALIHHNYDSLTQFIDRLSRYTKIQATELVKKDYRFSWMDLITKPTSEFLSRFFANRGFEDGVHGLALSLLQAFSFLIMYLRVWEMEKFTQQEINLKEVKEVKDKIDPQIDYWFQNVNLSKNPFKRFIQKARNKI